MSTPSAFKSESLERFVVAQLAVYDTALEELRRRRKTSHWMWFVFPQLRGLGSSDLAHRYGITGLDEARAYVAHPLLGPRLRECVGALLQHEGTQATAILGSVDAMKLRSSLTLFAIAAPSETLFSHALDAFFDGDLDRRTQALLG